MAAVALNQWNEAEPLAAPWIDHLGLVVADVAPVVAALREAGFLVSDPQQLQGASGPMGQVSAHCVFPNGYLEISAPLPGAGNHLEPLLAQGEGWRLLLFRTDDAETERQNLLQTGVRCSQIDAASRQVRLDDRELTARFRWFSVPDLIPGILTAYVEHCDPDVVFDASLCAHPNGATGLGAVLFGKEAQALSKLPGGSTKDGPDALIASQDEPAIAGLSASGCPALHISSHSLNLAAFGEQTPWSQS